jgi:HD-GYP domain-containing protein (c-di-GMP phosphodiesterase class II)
LTGPSVSEIRLSELIGALSHALDIAEGQPEGHAVRCCWIGMHLGELVGLSERERWELYYTLLLKDLGCSSNAARICQLYLTDDLAFKRDFKAVDGSLPQVMRFVLSHTGLKAGLARRFHALMTLFSRGGEIASELIQTRCQRGAAIARRLRFSAAVAEGIHSLDEHWDGRGRPQGLRGEAIPLYSRIALMAQVVDVFHSTGGPLAALREVERRGGSWFEPALVHAFRDLASSDVFWQRLASPELVDAVLALEPGCFAIPLDDDYLDDIAGAFGQVVDAKSPYTAGHGARVALYADLVAEALGISDERRRWLRRGALLHDVGKLGVSNTILDKPGKLDEEEWKAVQAHAAHTEAILSRVNAFSELARVAAAHHERLDGKGYPRGFAAGEISLETRIITVADVFDAITAARPYRDAVPVPRTLEIMAENVGSAIDADCFAALRRVVEQMERAQGSSEQL